MSLPFVQLITEDYTLCPGPRYNLAYCCHKQLEVDLAGQSVSFRGARGPHPANFWVSVGCVVNQHGSGHRVSSSVGIL